MTYCVRTISSVYWIQPFTWHTQIQGYAYAVPPNSTQPHHVRVIPIPWASKWLKIILRITIVFNYVSNTLPIVLLHRVQDETETKPLVNQDYKCTCTKLCMHLVSWSYIPVSSWSSTQFLNSIHNNSQANMVIRHPHGQDYLTHIVSILEHRGILLTLWYVLMYINVIIVPPQIAIFCHSFVVGKHASCSHVVWPATREHNGPLGQI